MEEEGGNLSIGRLFIFIRTHALVFLFFFFYAAALKTLENFDAQPVRDGGEAKKKNWRGRKK